VNLGGETKIPARVLGVSARVPGVKGKENRGRGGARIAKPVNTKRFNIEKQELRASSVPGILIEFPQQESNSPLPPSSTSPVPIILKSSSASQVPIILKSKAVPHLHQVLLKKIRHNKRKSLERTPSLNESPCKAPAPATDLDRVQSPVSVTGHDLQMYLSGVFDIADKYKSGTVSAVCLLECITGMVDLPKLDKWKLEELKRLLDPNDDNRYVDSGTWAVVGESWVEMMLNPDFHAATSISDKSSDNVEVEESVKYQERFKDEVFEDNGPEIGNVSFEGIGGISYQLHSNREYELQSKVSELEFQVAKLREEKKEMERSLVASEEFGLSLTSELEDSHRRLSLSTNTLKDETIKENSELAREWERQCVSLQLKLSLLEEDLRARDERLADNEVLMVNLKVENAEAKEKESAALVMLGKLREKTEMAELMIKKKDEEISKEIVARELVEERFEATRMMVDRLEQDLSMKEEEIKNLTETTGGSRLGSVGSSNGGNTSFSTIHDVSVDEKAIEAHQNLLTPGRLSLPTGAVVVKLRGPSASSTPNKQHLGSIAEELMNLNGFNESESLPYPFCEKKESLVRAALDKLLENVRREIGTQLESNKKKEIVLALAREVNTVKQFLEEIINDLPSKEDFQSLTETNTNLSEKLSEANLFIENLNNLKSENNNEIEEDEEDVPLEEVANISRKVEAVAGLLKTANSVLMAHTEDTDFSLEPDTDVSGWQLDLEGIQLVEMQQRLVSYSKKRSSGVGLRSAFPSELSRSPVPGTPGLLWQNLHNRLEDLQRASEMSRDLLVLAGDSLRDQSASLLLSRHLPPTAQPCQVSSAEIQTEEMDTTHEMTQTEETVSHSSSACPTDNCFCSRSQSGRQTQSSLRSIFRGVLIMVVLCLFFTFFCGLKIDSETYYPVTWYSLRMALGDSLNVPEPVIAVNYQTAPRI